MPGFLSDDMSYSCGIFPELDTDLHTPDTKSKDGFWLKNARETYDPSVSVPSSPSSVTTAPPEYDFDELREAQMRKVRHIISKAQIKPGHRVLEIGSGWGTMAIEIAQAIPGTEVDSVTISVAQQELAIERVKRAGLEDRVRIHLMDYRLMPEAWKGSFDRLVSVEMMEAVGREYMNTFWKQVNWALKQGDAVGVVQCITLPEARKFFFPQMRRYLSPC